MARLTANTVLTRPGTLDLVTLTAGEEVPDWAEGMIGDHLIGGDPAPDADSGNTGGGNTEGGNTGSDADSGDADSGESGATPDASWTVADLREYAKTNGVDLDGATAKADILAAING